MAYKQYQNIRDHRIYAYLNQKELDAFLEAMRIQDLAIQGKAARQMIVERSQQIIAEHRKNNPQSAMKQTVKYHLPHGVFYRAKPNQAIEVVCQRHISDVRIAAAK